jgi:hypothetical protein
VDHGIRRYGLRVILLADLVVAYDGGRHPATRRDVNSAATD